MTGTTPHSRKLGRNVFPLVLVTLVSLMIAALLTSQHSSFNTLQTLSAQSCHDAPSRMVTETPDTIAIRCRIDTSLPANVAASADTASSARLQDLAILAPIFRDSLTVAVNGIPAGQVRLNQWRMPARLATIPAIIAIPKTSLNPGINRLDITVSATAGRAPILGKLYIGAEGAVLKQFHRLWFITQVLPTLVLGGQAALALLLFTIWNRRRQETAFGWFALVLLLDTLRGSPVIPLLGIEASNVSYWSLLVPFSSAAYLMFAGSFVGQPRSSRIWLAWASPVCIAAAAAVLSPAAATGILLPIGVIAVCVNLSAAAAVLAQGWRFGVPKARLMFICTLLFAGMVVHDVLLSLRWIDSEIAIARPGLLILLMAMVVVMINRFTSAMAETDRTTETLRLRTRQIEAELKHADEKLREQRERAIIAQERSRLMRDLHDGLGGEMVAVLALAEQEAVKGPEIAYHARAALSDMRLIIASLEDYGGNLAMALGAWKERAEPQIFAAGMALSWDLDDLHDEMRFCPTQLLDILRILQEALTNVIQHARATNVTLQARFTSDGLCLSFIDDGEGIAGDLRRGRGLPNMRSRAVALGGTLDIVTRARGTSIDLRVPRPKK